MEFYPELALRYEELRSQALKEAITVATPLGVALLEQKGTAAWILAWSSSPDAPRVNKFSEPLPDLLRSELAMLLAGMLVKNRRFKNEPPKGKSFPSATERLPIRQAIHA